MSRRILIASVSAGAGHVRAAQAVAETLPQNHKDVTLKNVDTMDYVFRPFRLFYAGGYLKLINSMPNVWAWIYSRTALQSPLSAGARFSRWLEAANCGRLGRLIRDFAPDEILSTHPLPLHYACRLKKRGKLRSRISVVVTDYCLHPLWVHPGVDVYFAGSPEVAHFIRGHGAAPERIRVTGIPLVPPFAEPLPATERARIRREMMLSDERPTVLCSAGGFGVGRIYDTILAAITAASRAGGADLLVVAGRNQALRGKLANVKTPDNVKLTVFGFVNNMHDLMGVADVMITKPGGLTITEALSRHLPMIVLDPIPGQEEWNSTYLLENGAAWRAHDLASLDYKLGKLLASPEERAAMRRACEKIAHPRAASEIAQVLASGI